MILQLDPPIPVYVINRGKALAHFIIDRGVEFHLEWVVFMDDSTECWTVQNPQVRAQKNITYGRLGDKIMAEKWIQKAVGKGKGNLHKNLGVPQGEKIPAKKMAKAAKSKSPQIRKEVALAKTLKGLRK